MFNKNDKIDISYTEFDGTLTRLTDDNYKKTGQVRPFDNLVEQLKKEMR